MDAPTADVTVYQFDEFELTPSDRTLVRGDNTIALQPRTFDVLLTLVTHAGTLVNKEQFRAQVWDGAVVTDNALTRCIRQLRAALNDSRANPQFITTVPRHGYRFIAAVSSSESVAKRTSPATPAASTRARPLVLVLPFQIDLAVEGANHLRSEITEEVVDRLAEAESLTVMASHSSRLIAAQSLPLPTLSEDYGVAYVITGSARASEDEIQLRIECVKTEDSSPLWSQRRRLPESEIAQLARVAADSVCERLTGSPSATTPAATINERAYSCYLLAKSALKHSRFPKAVAHAERSIEHEANNPQAHTLLAQTFLTWATYGLVPEPDPLVRSQRHLRQASAAGTADQEGIRLEAQLALYLERDYEKAIRLCSSIKADSSVTAAFLFYGFQFEAGINQQRRLADRDPLNLQALIFSQRMLRFVGKTQAANHYHQLCLDIDAEHLMVLQDRLDIALYNNQMSEAAGLLDLMLQQQDMPWWPHIATRCLFGSKLEAYSGNLKKALALADEFAQQDGLQPTLKAEAYFNAQNLDGVFHWMDVGIREFDPGIYQMITPFSVRTKDDPLMEAFEADPRYTELRARLGIDQQTLHSIDWTAIQSDSAVNALH